MRPSGGGLLVGHHDHEPMVVSRPEAVDSVRIQSPARGSACLERTNAAMMIAQPVVRPSKERVVRACNLPHELPSLTQAAECFVKPCV